MNSIVYVATNRVNGKRYVGVTCKRLGRRRYQHEWNALNERGKCPKFHAAIRKYGVGSFDWAEFGQFATLEEALAEERKFIAELRPEYNLTAGGEGTSGYVKSQESIEKHRIARAGWRPTEEMRRKQSLAQTGKKCSPEKRAKLSAIFKGRTISPEARARLSVARKGVGHTLETRMKMSATRKGRPRPAWVTAKIIATKSARRMADQMSLNLGGSQ